MTAVPPFIPHPSQPTAVDLCNGYTYTFPPSTGDTATSCTPPARLAVFDPQLLWDRLRAPIEQLFPLSSVVLRGKTGQVTISNVDVQVVSIHSSSLQPVPSPQSAALRSAISWQHLPYLHLYLLATASYTAYVKHHRQLIAPFIAAFTDASSSAAASSGSTVSLSAASTSTSTSPLAGVIAGSDALLLYCIHADDRRDSKSERKILDKLRSEWGKDAVVAVALPDEWWAGWAGEGGGGGVAAVSGEEGVMSSISISSLFPSSSSSSASSSVPSPGSGAVPPLSASLLPSLRGRFTSSFSARCDSLHSIVHSLLLLSSYPHWPFTRFLLVQLAAARVHCQFGLYVEALRLLDEAEAVMAGATVQQLIGDAATQNKVRLRYLYDEGGAGSGEEEELFHNRLSLLQCERLLHAQQAAILRRMGRLEEVVVRGEALLVRWMDREGWEVWGWLLGCLVDVWSRAEREVRERHADERRSRVSGVSGEDDKREDKSGGDDESKEQKHRRHRLSTTTVRPRSITPERRRHSPKPHASLTTTANNPADDSQAQSQPASGTERPPAAAPAPSAPGASQSRSHKRSHTSRQLASASERGNHALTSQLRQLHAQRVSSMFGCIRRLLEERKRVEREKGRLDVLDDEARVECRRRRDRLRDDREERLRRLAEWREREGNDYLLQLDDEVSGGEAVYEQRQRKVEYAMQHSPLFPLLLHALLFLASPSAAHSHHFMSLYCHAFSALSLPALASSLHLHLASVYCSQRWLGLAVREMQWRLREERDAGRWVGAGHSALMLLGLCGGVWLDVRVRELSEDVAGATEWQDAGGVVPDQSDASSGEFQVKDPPGVLALFHRICSQHLTAVRKAASEQSLVPAYHRCRGLDAGPLPARPVLPLPRPSIPSPAALTSIMLSSRASLPPSTGPVAFVVPLSALVPIDSLTVTIHPCFAPLHLCLRFVLSSSLLSPLHSVVLDDVAFTLSLQRDGERVDIDCEYQRRVQLTGGDVWLHAVVLAEGSTAPQLEAVDGHHLCVLRLAADDYTAIQCLLAVAADDESGLLVSLSHVWMRYQRLHLLPLDRLMLDEVLTVNVDYAAALAKSTVAGFDSAARFLLPLFAHIGAFSLSPRSSLTSAPLSLALLSASLPALLDSTASLVLALQLTAALPFCHLSFAGEGVALVGAVRLLISSADGVVEEERVVAVVDGAALLGPLSSPSLCMLDCRVSAPASPRCSAADDVVDVAVTARVSADATTSIDLPFTVQFMRPFFVSSSFVHMGHRLFVSVSVRCLQSGLQYRFDRLSVVWGPRWSVVSAAREAEVQGVVVAGGADVRLMYEVEAAKTTQPLDDEDDGELHLHATVTSRNSHECDAALSLSSDSFAVVSRLPFRLPAASLGPPLLHLILSAPSSARLGQPVALSLTLLLSAATSAEPPAPPSQVLCCVSASASWFISGRSTFTARLSAAAPSRSHSVVLLPLQAGALLLPSIAVKERRQAAAGGGTAGDDWVAVSEARLQCHFGTERMQVLPTGSVRCDMEREVVLYSGR